MPLTLNLNNNNVDGGGVDYTLTFFDLKESSLFPLSILTSVKLQPF